MLLLIGFADTCMWRGTSERGSVLLRLRRFRGETGTLWDSVQYTAQLHLFPRPTLICYTSASPPCSPPPPGSLCVSGLSQKLLACFPHPVLELPPHAQLFPIQMQL